MRDSTFPVAACSHLLKQSILFPELDSPVSTPDVQDWELFSTKINLLKSPSWVQPSNTAMTETTASVKRSAGVSGWHSPMQRVSKEGLQDRISTSLLEHWVQVWQGFSAESTSEKVPGLHVWHTVSPWMPHSWTTPVPFMHLEQGAHTLCWAKKKKPSSHSHSVFLVAEQGRRVGTPSGQLLHGRQRPRPWDSENVPREKITKSASV